MDRNRGKTSRFGPRESYNGPPPNQNHMQMQYPPRHMQMQQKPMQQNSMQQNSMQQPLTDEQRAFELEFKKWEQSFSDWQKAYANHHDRIAYKNYEQKFLDVRDKLLVKRSQIYSNNTIEHQLASELGAAAAMADSILQKFGEPSMPSFDNRRGESNNNRYEDRFARPPPMMNSRYDDNRSDRQNRSRSPYYNRDPPSRQDGRMGGRRQNFSRSPPRNQGNRDQRRPNDRNQRDMQQQRGGRQDNRRDENSKNRQQEPVKMVKKPKEAQIKKDLERKDVYPNVPWNVVTLEEKPPLVGKRKKNMRAKIVKLLEIKEKIANGEMLASDGEPKDKIAQLYDEAKKLDCPNRLSGAARRKFANLSAKIFTEWSEDDKRFIEFAEYTRKAREKYFEENRDKEKVDKKENDDKVSPEPVPSPMETENVSEAPVVEATNNSETPEVSA